MNFSAPVQLKTDRLILRKLSLEDAVKLFNGYCADVDATHFLVFRPHTCISQTEEFLRACISEWEEGTSFAYVIELDTPEREFIGIIHPRVSGHSVSVGYALSKNAWGKGYGTEALICIADWAFSNNSVYRFTASCDVDNQASARIMEKAGLSYEGLCRKLTLHPNISSEPRDCLLYAKTR